jgi:hypothetical protein
VRKRPIPEPSRIVGVLLGKPSSGIRPPKQTKKVLKMSEDTLSADDYDYTNAGTRFLQENVHVVYEEVHNVDDLDVEIVEKELQLLTTKRRALQRRETGL